MAPKSPSPRDRARPQVEALEDRLAPALLTNLPLLTPPIDAPALLAVPDLPIAFNEGRVLAPGGLVVGRVRYQAPGRTLVTDQYGSVAGYVRNAGHWNFQVTNRLGYVVGHVFADGPFDALVTNRDGHVVGHARARAGSDNFLITDRDGSVVGAVQDANRFQAGAAGLLLLLHS